MPVNIERMAKDKASHQRGGDFWKPEVGENVLYVHPPCRGDDDEWMPTTGLPYIEAIYHFGIGKVGGKEGVSVMCLDPTRNPILKHPFIQEYLKQRGIKLDLTKPCPVCEKIKSGELTEEEAKDMRPSTRWLWGVTPMSVKRPGETAPSLLAPKPQVFSCGTTIYNGLTDAFSDNADITDMEHAIFVKIGRTGKGLGTKYAVGVDIKSAKMPVKLEKGFARLIRDAIQPGGDCDLFRIIAYSIRGHKEVAASIMGISTEDGDAADGSDVEPVRATRSTSKRKEEEAPPSDDDVPFEESPTPAEKETGAEELMRNPPKPCFGLDFQDDPECRSCKYNKPCAKICLKGASLKKEAGTKKEEAEPPAAVKAASKPASKSEIKPAPKSESKEHAKEEDDGVDDLMKELMEMSK